MVGHGHGVPSARRISGARVFHGVENFLEIFPRHGKQAGGAAGKSHAKAQRAQREEKGGKKLEIYHESHENHEKSGENGPKMAK